MKQLFRMAGHLITWGEAWEQGLRDLNRFGFRGCEPRAYIARQWADRPQSFGALLAAHGMELAALYTDCKLLDPDADVASARQTAAFLQALGARTLVIGGGVRKEGGGSEAEWALLVRTLHAIGRECRSMGIRACFHPHLGTLVETPGEIDRIMADTDPELVWLAADCAHIQKGGGAPHEVVRRYAARLGHVHIKDLNPGAEYRTGEDRLSVFTELGRGALDLRAFADALLEAGYDGWVSVELDRSHIGPAESLRINVDYLRNRLGLQI